MKTKNLKPVKNAYHSYDGQCEPLYTISGKRCYAGYGSDIMVVVPTDEIEYVNYNYVPDEDNSVSIG